MKELSIEEKAKAYDKALVIAKSRYSIETEESVRICLELMFPELCESEDERMVKFIKNQLFNIKKTITENYELDAKLTNAIDWLEKQGEQKPADNAEPKFEIGDLITNGVLVGKIDRIYDWGYHVYFGDYYSDVPDVENWHKWTIQDAKDGDVLFTSSTASHETFIFKSIDEKGNAKCYFTYDSEDGFREGKYHFIGKATDCKPATKEQRDTLEKAMADAGYTFDFEKKELKNIKQRSAEWSEEDNEIIEALNLYVKNLDLFYESIKISNTDILAHEFREKVQSWLKSLKGRVQPQTTWKPSGLQLQALNDATYNCNNEYSPYLESLYNDLKKLKG